MTRPDQPRHHISTLHFSRSAAVWMRLKPLALFAGAALSFTLSFLFAVRCWFGGSDWEIAIGLVLFFVGVGCIYKFMYGTKGEIL